MTIPSTDAIDAQPLPDAEQIIERIVHRLVHLRAADKRWSPDEDALLRKSAGLFSTDTIARWLGRTALAVKNRARVLGIRLCTGGPRARFAPVVKARALSMLAAGQSLRATAEAIGASFVTVWRWQQAALESP